ncbi:MAG: endonuclease [Candidatus Buchananbacteria bacterium RIFCSPHIGHO2_02_FULL_38_8]|uniref:Endonuclease n=2 Tax=Candidatus Buchananiibacteriota TaxID=1817903 RepID=A0A1G1XYL9_9BACT|nr:MAG: endonuclease [Candidatus Buchananbacteria bacterium RIFCSPHIGHO2_01_FULL_39_8]OGY47868.1 MAG: endonuclease [Candidatus Buchananbacteria bacterium RIFCSPHIGHO2_02_FULL_38_8]
MYYVYVIKSQIVPYIYVGISDNLSRRIRQHNKGYNKTTRPYKPFTVLLVEEYSSRIEAHQREKYLKSGCGKELLKKI